MIRRWALIVLGALAGSLLLPAESVADGLPIGGGDTTSQGVLAPDGDRRYLAFTGDSETTVAKVATGTGAAEDWLHIPGRFTVPSVTLDGITEGLSADGRTLVLIRPRITFPQERTELAVIDPQRMRLIDRIRLDGDFSYDAISPDGETAYLIEYVSRRDYLRYDVRAYDLERDRLLPEPIVDPREPEEEMGGLPYDRLQSANGRWAYTLYASPGGHPFVHALDTVGRTAACIDLHMLEGRGHLDGFDLAFGPGGDELIVNGKDGDPVASIDASTWEVTEASGGSAAEAVTEANDGGAPVWALALGGLFVAGLVLSLAWKSRRASRRSGLDLGFEERPLELDGDQDRRAGDRLAEQEEAVERKKTPVA
jgi:hypothetical protein